MKTMGKSAVVYLDTTGWGSYLKALRLKVYKPRGRYSCAMYFFIQVLRATPPSLVQKKNSLAAATLARDGGMDLFPSIQVRIFWNTLGSPPGFWPPDFYLDNFRGVRNFCVQRLYESIDLKDKVASFWAVNWKRHDRFWRFPRFFTGPIRAPVVSKV